MYTGDVVNFSNNIFERSTPPHQQRGGVMIYEDLRKLKN